MNETFGKFLLSGGSGLIGSAIRSALTARGSAVTNLVRRSPRYGDILWNPESATPFANTGALEGFTASIHLSGADVSAHRWTAAYKHEIVTSRVNSTRALATALAGLRVPPKTLLVASAVGIYGNRGEEALDEHSSPGSGFLAEVCAAWEAAAQPAVDAGIRVVPLRFGVVLAPDGGAVARMIPLFKLGLGGRLGNGKQWMSCVSLTDVVRAAMFAIETPSISGPINVTAPSPVTNAYFTRALASRLHRPALIPAPAFALRLAFGEMADEALLASARVYPRKLIDAGFTFSHPTIENALAAILS